MISQEQLAAVAAQLPAAPSVEELRQQFPGVMFTVCGEDDVPARLVPIMETPAHLLYLFTNAGGHCLEFTTDPSTANGIVVAARGDEY